MAEFSLPDLPYDYSALEPHISAKIMELHHSKHHATYVKGANAALEQLAAAREAGDFSNINRLEKDLAFNAGGVNNHSIFWTNLTPDFEEPTGSIKDLLDNEFGGLDKFQAQFTAAALGIQGSGWAVLGRDNVTGNVSTFQLFDQQGNVPFGVTPLLMLDMWEHAFYLDYQNVKPDYVKAFWNIVNWKNVGERLDAAVAAK
ncbi:superoxide dismutase [Gulosibacter bifidus]|uniref:Superoxide dismutase n=1 Tax=Gulosibacter bifidus TaxID=272239 RepID=A0ABW5RGK6_9MICO|nr:superoxide dismutase [Gulosibacter bifidus]